MEGHLLTKGVELSVLEGGLILFGGNHSSLSSSSPGEKLTLLYISVLKETNKEQTK